jgi:glycosyltransferase involved in cell wall biosynthesis
VTVPLVSVGMPVYNGERYLKLALDSLLGQTYTDFELVISDNASTDATEEICRAYAAADERIRYERADENRGAMWNFNHVFALCRGELFRWACYDDLCAPTHLESLVNAFAEAPPAVVLCYTQTQLIDENGEPAGVYDDRLDLREPKARQRLVHLVSELRLANPLYGLMRREVVARTRLMGPYPGSDLVWLAEMALQGEWREVPGRLFIRRLHPQMSTRANTTRSQIAEWFDPSRKGQNATEAWRITGEYLRAIHRSPLGFGERLAAYATFLPVHLRAARAKLMREAIEVTAIGIARPVGSAVRRIRSA